MNAHAIKLTLVNKHARELSPLPMRRLILQAVSSQPLYFKSEDLIRIKFSSAKRNPQSPYICNANANALSDPKHTYIFQICIKIFQRKSRPPCMCEGYSRSLVRERTRPLNAQLYLMRLLNKIWSW